MKKQSVLFVLLSFVAAAMLLSCESGGGGYDDLTSSLKFDLSGAKAIAGAKASSRADGTNDSSVLSKIVEDGSVASLFDLEDGVTVEEWPAVTFIGKGSNSPEIYVNFAYNLSLTKTSDMGGMKTTVGSFLCIKEDGSFVDILKQDEGTWSMLSGTDPITGKQPIVFDSEGNVYYILNEFGATADATTTTIYRFDPKTDKSEPMTATQTSIAYQDFFVSADGTYLFAKVFAYGGGSYTQYLRAIPVDNPANFKNIFYSTTTASINAYTFNPESKTVYLSGYEIFPGNISGVYSAKSSDYENLASDITGTINGIDILYSHSLNCASDGSVWGIAEVGAAGGYMKKFVKLYDNTGSVDVKLPTAFNDGKYLPVKIRMGEGYIYFSCSGLKENGTETGYQTIKRVSLANPDVLEDVLTNVPNNTTLEISDFSVKGNTLYFAAIQGIDQVAGSIDLSTPAFNYSAVSAGFTIGQIMAY